MAGIPFSALTGFSAFTGFTACLPCARFRLRPLVRCFASRALLFIKNSVLSVVPMSRAMLSFQSSDPYPAAHRRPRGQIPGMMGREPEEVTDDSHAEMGHYPAAAQPARARAAGHRGGAARPRLHRRLVVR